MLGSANLGQGSVPAASDDEDTGGNPFPGYGVPGNVDPNEPVTGVSTGVMRSDAILGQKIKAQWGSVASRRFYAASEPAGNNTRAGFSDLSMAGAGLVSVQSLAQLGLLIPPLGNARLLKVAIQARAAGATYADRLSTLGWMAGYSNPLIYGTATDATAGVTAFDGSLAELQFAGGRTATGMFAAGYNPTGVPTASAFTCQRVGGAAPAFPAEPGLPLGARVRFSSTTATVALRNACASINAVPANNSLQLTTSLPAAPGLTDVFYIEQPGCSIPGFTGLLGAGSMATGGNGNAPGLQMNGLEFTGSFRPSTYGASNWSFCRFLSTFAAQDSDIFFNTQCFDTSLGAAITGGCRADGSMTFFQCPKVVLDGLCVLGTLTLKSCAHYEITVGTVAAAGIILQGAGLCVSGQAQTESLIGSVATPTACRVTGTATSGPLAAGLIVDGSRCNLATVNFTGMGARPAIQLSGTCDVNIGAPGGATGNNDVGLDLTASRGSRIWISGVPTVTGALGDVRLSDGTIVTWANLIGFAQTDRAGNRFITAGGNGMVAPVANGAVVVGLGAFGPAGVAATPVRWARLPDGIGGFFTVASYT